MTEAVKLQNEMKLLAEISRSLSIQNVNRNEGMKLCAISNNGYISIPMCIKSNTYLKRRNISVKDVIKFAEAHDSTFDVDTDNNMIRIKRKNMLSVMTFNRDISYNYLKTLSDDILSIQFTENCSKRIQQKKKLAASRRQKNKVLFVSLIAFLNEWSLEQFKASCPSDFFCHNTAHNYVFENSYKQCVENIIAIMKR